jgi:hypothetical protein
VQYIGDETAYRHIISMPLINTKRINRVIIFTLQIHPDGFVSVNFFFATSDYKLIAFGINCKRNN